MDLGFWAIAQADPDHLALVTPEGEEVRAGELLAEVNRLSHGLRSEGVGVGDAVAAVLPNGKGFLELYLACLQIGVYLVPINHHLVRSEIEHIVDDSEAKLLFVHERFSATAPEGTTIDRVKAGQPDTLPAERTAGGVMNYTSGTTGRPKGVRRPLSGLSPEESVLSFGSGMLLLFGLQPADDNVHIVGSPLYHTAVLVFGGGSMHLGHTLVVMDKWTPEGMLDLIERYKVTSSHMVPTQFHRLLALPPDARLAHDVSSLRHMVHAAAPCPVEIKHRMIEWWGNAIDEYYAASEGGGTMVSAEEWLAKPGTVGKPWPISEVAIFDDEGGRLGSSQVGTVYMKMQTGQFEYYKDKAKTDKSRIGDFFTVGDVGELDDDGFLFLRDRKIDMIISGGTNIYPSEIEGVLLTHPKVGDAAAFGIPHADWGEEVKAVIEPAPGVDADEELADEILAFCADKLARFKTPKSIDFTTEMPRDPNGKLYKRKLRDPYWEGRERTI